MAFYESPRFPERISFGARGGPTLATEVVTIESGREKRNARWSYPRHEWDVAHAARTQDEFDELREHFLSVDGRANGFRFKDWSDFEATVAQGFVTGITSTTFQLVKKYISGAQSKTRRIRKPIASGFAIYNSAVLLIPTTDYTLNTTTGIVTTATSKTAANLTWSGEFDVPVRYDTDKLSAEIINRNDSGLLYRWDSIPLVEDMSA